jgi:hypothetical protein
VQTSERARQSQASWRMCQRSKRGASHFEQRGRLQPVIGEVASLMAAMCSTTSGTRCCDAGCRGQNGQRGGEQVAR